MSRPAPFDRIADVYDATRGGLRVGTRFAEAVALHVPSERARIVEVGIGTGLVAGPLTERGYSVLGVDLSTKMIAVARERIGARVVIGDVTCLPIASESCDAVVAARVLHVVSDPASVLADAARILRPDGLIVVILAGLGHLEPRDDIDEATKRMREGPLRGPDSDATIASANTVGTLELVALDLTPPLEYDESPRDYAEKIRERTWVGFWEMNDETWARTAEPSIAALLALPEPDRPRRRQRSHRVLVFARR